MQGQEPELRTVKQYLLEAVQYQNVWYVVQNEQAPLFRTPVLKICLVSRLFKEKHVRY